MKRILALVLSAALCVGLLPTASVAAAEVAVENVAIGKALYPSSTMGGYSPAAVTDGNYATNWARGNLGANEHMMIDLGEPHRINSVVIYPRLDVNQDQYRQRVAIEFSNTPDFAVKERIVAMGDDPTPYGEGVEVNPSKTPYRYVRVIKMDTQILVLAEIEIYGYVPDPNESNLGKDVSGSFCEGPATLISHLGIMGNVNDEIFGIDHLMTRAEAADATVRMAFGGTTGFNAASVPFSDVTKAHKNYEGIAAAYGLGIISGDGNSRFRPDDYVTETELTYMTMRAIGYSEKVVGSSAALMNYCKKHGILDNVEGDEESGLISRGNAAIMLYNALLAPTIEMSISTNDNYYVTDGLNTLAKKYGITLTKGIVQENKVTRLDGDAKTDEYAADVSGRKLVDKGGKLNDFLGREVIYATQKDNPDAVVLAWLTGEDKVVELKDSELLSTVSDIRNGYIIAEGENGKERKYPITSNIPVVVNGYSDPYWQPEDLVIDRGSLRLVNNDGDNAYDVVFADVYSLHYLNAVISEDEQMTLVNSKGVKKTISTEGLRVTDNAGKTVSASKVKKDTLIKLYETSTGKDTKIAVYNSPISGKLTVKYGEEFVIDDERYPLSSYYKNNRPADEPKIGKTVEFFTDDNGEILWISEDADGATDWVVAFSQATDTDNADFDQLIRMRVFDENGTWHIYEVADKIQVDGVLKSKSAFATMLTNAKGTSNWIYEKAFIRYKLNRESKIREIDTTVKNADVEDDISLEPPTTVASGLYTKESGAFWLEHKQLAVVKNETPVFVIPTVGGQYTTDTEFDDLYSVSANVVNVAGNRSSQEQNLDLYMPDESGLPTFLAKKQGYASSTGGLTAITGDSAPNIIVSSIETEISDTDIVYKITGKNMFTYDDVSFYADENINVIEAGVLYQEKYGTSCFGSRGIIQVSALTTLSESEKERYISNVSEIGFGDVIRYETLNSKARAIERVFDYEPTGLPSVTLTAANANPQVWFAANGTYPDHYIAFNRFQLGSISDVSADTFTITSLKGANETYIKSSVPKIFACTGGRVAAIEEASDLYEFTDGNYKAIVYSYNATPKVVVVYEFDN